MSVLHKVVGDYMSPFPHTVGVELTLAAAAERMWQLGVRHLPVLDGEELVGIISQRDISFARSFATADAERTTVEEAMTPEPMVVGPEMPLGVVARTMAERRVGCAIVVDQDRVVGIVTTTDALALLADLLDAGTLPAAPDVTSAAVRKRILDEHQVIRRLLRSCERLAERVLSGDDGAEAELSENARELYQTLIRHFDVEDALLVPALREAAPEQADAMDAEHASQRTMLRKALSELDSGNGLAQSVLELIERVRLDMQHEERDYLSDSA